MKEEINKIKMKEIEAQTMHVTVKCVDAFLKGVGMKDGKDFFKVGMKAIAELTLAIDNKYRSRDFQIVKNKDDIIFKFTVIETDKMSRWSWMSDISHSVYTTLKAWESIGMKVPDSYLHTMLCICHMLQEDSN